ncbi:hypothetical protein HDU93_005958 [Gonapodya sp. JEL0774]|nr:hypothetical protein HDU93_005958 [Gonapodya sp. JEL0774]
MELDHQLINVVESGKIDEVRGLLTLGACPSARKAVTLEIRFPGHPADGSEETKSDTIECESALALAFFHRHVDAVALLLQHGADANAEVECSRWENGVVQRNRRQTSNIGEQPQSQQSWWASYRSEPETKEDARQYFHLSPHLDIVRLLLQNGANVTDRGMDAAKAFPDKRFAKLLAEHRRASTSIPQAHHTTVIDQVIQIQGLTARSVATDSREASDEERIAKL